jgi:uncharacterized SAM-binding protein YcdF (DUF218 family)
MMKKISIKRLFLFIISIIIIYIFITAVNICIYSKVDNKQPADVAIILGAGATDESISPVFQERINHGISLYQNNYVKKLIFTGGTGKGNQNSDAYIAMQYAIKQGVPANDILLEEKSTITQENIKNAKDIMDKNSYHTAIIVSDPLHMKRAVLMAENYKIDCYSSPTPTTKYVSLKSTVPFLFREVFFYIGYRLYNIFQYILLLFDFKK